MLRLVMMNLRFYEQPQPQPDTFGQAGVRA
jgi:hypothetical protein